MAANYGSLFGQVHNMWKGSSARPFNESLFVKSCFATKSLHCQELKAHKWGVSVLEFADNGQFFASGGCDDRVLLWSIDKALGSQDKPILVLSPHIHGGGGTITSLAFSPDNNQVFSSGYSDKSVFIYDITTEKQVCKISFNEHRGGPVESISFYPESKGDVFVTAGGGSLAILDKRTRRSSMIKDGSDAGGRLFSAMFSPSNPNLLAAAGELGTQIIDIRYSPNQRMRGGSKSCYHQRIHFFSAEGGSQYVRFNGRGDRMLCITDNNQAVVYDLPNRKKRSLAAVTAAGTVGKVQLTAPGYIRSTIAAYTVNGNRRGSCCFAGKDDELVVAASDLKNDLIIWSLPDGHGERTVAVPLLVLPGDTDQSKVNCLRYSPQNCMLASGAGSYSGNSKIRFWTPFTLPPSIGDEPKKEEPATSDENDEPFDDSEYAYSS